MEHGGARDGTPVPKKVYWQPLKLPDLVDHLKDAVFKPLNEASRARFNPLRPAAF
jgi:hypothetical protein